MTPFEPIPIYKEGKLDKKYWYTLQATRYLKDKGEAIVRRTDLIFTEHKLTYN